MFACRSGLVNNKAFKKDVDTSKQINPKSQNTDGKNKDDKSSSNGKDDKLSEKESTQIGNFKWDYNPLSMFIETAEKADLKDAKIRWQDKTDPNVKVVLLRHAQTPFNSLHDRLFSDLMKKKISKMNFAINFGKVKKDESAGLVNSTLTEKGIQVVRDAAPKFREQFPNIKYVFCSPMRRTIMTLENIMDGYPGWAENKIKVELMPELREVIMSSSDVGCYIDHEEFRGIQNKKRFDWSFMKNAEDPHFWFLDSMSQERKKNSLKAMEGCVSVHDKRTALLNELSKVKYLPYDYETGESNYLRIKVAAMEKLRQAIKKHQLKDNEVLIVGHAITFAYFWGDGFNNVDYKAKTFKIMKNAEFLEYPLYWPQSREYELEYLKENEKAIENTNKENSNTNQHSAEENSNEKLQLSTKKPNLDSQNQENMEEKIAEKQNLTVENGELKDKKSNAENASIQHD